ncbi:asparagine synthetase B family protein [Streptomyces doebereineriae]|uniref:Asparagine synthetase domain-containing protein n=1 Tax=Streptomyces doebereineriae TaxID=3075528 RepID=A0ABU2V8K3_9ACTN|nr:hypothetical protein [Streptomyces sp. DSM 41640]MDT0481894.1 hypothetical protein [Streptomyces sp. DSM 41640]
MIAFLLTIRVRSGAHDGTERETLKRWLDRYPMLSDKTVHSWASSADGSVTCHWGGHSADHLGGVRYSATEREKFALFGGRPVLWRNGEADGRTSIDPKTYLREPTEWSQDLDGRHVVVRVDNRTVHVQTDAAGLLPVYISRNAEGIQISNMAALVTPVGAQTRPRALAGLLAGGWSITGEPLREGVERVVPGTATSISRDGVVTTAHLRTDYAELLAAVPDYAEAERLMTSLARAFADWPGRETQLALTGGRDSRVIAAVLRKADITPAVVTNAFAGQVGYPETGDVQAARHLSMMLGWEHSATKTRETAAVYSRTHSVLELLQLTSAQTTSLTDIMDVDLEPVNSLPILFDGVAGEIGRGAWTAYLGGECPTGQTVDEMAASLFEKITPGSPPALLNGDGKALIYDWLREFSREQTDRGVALADIPEVLHLERQASWHGPNLSNRDHREDTASLYLSPRIWPHMIGRGGGGHVDGKFNRTLLQSLGPDLAKIPYETADASWLQDNSVGATMNEERRRNTHMIPVEPIGAILDVARTAAHSHSDHPAWDVLDRKRVVELLERDPEQIRGVERYQLWSLATALAMPEGLR